MNRMPLWLEYLGFEVSDSVGWRRLLIDVIGLVPGSENPDGSLGFRMDAHAQRIFTIEGPRDEVCAIGLGTRNADEFAVQLQRIEAAGVAIEMASQTEAKMRRVAALARFRDPWGAPLELTHGAEIDPTPFESKLQPAGFVTGPLGLGHVLFLVPDLEAATRFYCDVVGFKVSDVGSAPLHGVQVDATFLFGTPRHHSLALASIGGAMPRFGLHFEMHVPTVDDVGRAYDRALNAGVPISNTLGRHYDGVFSFYGKTPSGIDFEIGTDGVMVDDNWQTQHLTSWSAWGHHSPD
jgi:2,3-dihydroxybiphenyl 1,2-dioxygenase